jgi:hypothetical protein
VWHSRRLSCDSFRHTDIGRTEIVGEAWNAIDQQWQPFTVDLRTGRSWGGAYHRGEADEWEQLAPG